MSEYTAFAQYYDQLTANIDYAARAAFFAGLIRRHYHKAELLLDLACGTGSLSLELAALGFDVIGADASREMLSVALQKVGDSPHSILFLCQSMQALDLYGTVDAVVCALDSLNHLPDDTALGRALDRVALFLNPGGVFVFDVNTAYKHRQILANNTFVYDLEDIYCVWQNTLTQPMDVVEIALDFFEKQENGLYSRSSTCFRERIFPPAVLEDMLRQRGFDILDVYGDDGLDSPQDYTQRLIYVTRKEEPKDG